tara:strand:- start:1540 stop:3090 length:1551 start_codon:yes stop_codon:yes gene_type:complete
MKIENLQDLRRYENRCTHIKDLQEFIIEFQDNKFLNKTPSEQEEFIKMYKKKLEICMDLRTKEELFVSDSFVVIVNDKKLKLKQDRLEKYKEPPSNDYSDSIKTVSFEEFNRNIKFGGYNTSDFKYMRPNSSSNSAIFKGYYTGEKCYFKTFTVENSKRLAYEQKIYNYIKKRNETLKGEIKDNFVELIDVFKISKLNFEGFFNKNIRTYRYHFQDVTLKYEHLFSGIQGVGRGPYYASSTHIYFIVTKDIEGITLNDYFDGILTNSDHPVNTKIKNIIEVLFELIYGLYILNQRLNIIHNDIHFGNVIFKKNDILPSKTYTINNMEFTRQRNHRLCIYDFDYSYLEGRENPDIKYEENLIYGRINNYYSRYELTDLDRGRDIYNIGNQIMTTPNFVPSFGLADFQQIFESTTYINILNLIFESDYIIENLRNSMSLTIGGYPRHFWNRYCNTTPTYDYNNNGYTKCDKLSDFTQDYKKINPEAVLFRFLKNETVRTDILEIVNINPLFKKFLKNL